jgi:hypothetical protein
VKKVIPLVFALSFIDGHPLLGVGVKAVALIQKTKKTKKQKLSK